MTCKILLAANPVKHHVTMSVEAGICDNIEHFDHHGNFCRHPAPCNNPAIPIADEGATIGITHFDADTFVGLLRMLGEDLPKGIDFDTMEGIDLNGSSVVEDLYDPTLLYMVGLGTLARENQFPRAGEDPQDVTDEVTSFLDISTEEIIEKGRISTAAVEKAYKECLHSESDNIGLWNVGASDSFDPSRPYKDGTEVVVVYRNHYKSISIYCNPETDHEFAGKVIAGIEFNGHPQACGSPRGKEMSLGDADNVFSELLAQLRG